MLGTTPALGASNMSHVANFGLYSMHSIMEFVSQHATVVATVLIPIGTILAMFACMMPGPNDRASVTRDPPDLILQMRQDTHSGNTLEM